ncbi:MAG TPA: hypothetical protein PKW51_08230 [Methanoregulaceae archaeon]|nr:hypothetical protein [Methanoregulaceae archaeon]
MESPISASPLVRLQFSRLEEALLAWCALQAEKGIQAIPATVRIFFWDTPPLEDIMFMVTRSR